MASQRPTGDLLDMLEKQAKEIRKIKRRLVRERVVVDTYTGNSSDPQTINLDFPAFVVLIIGTPSSGNISQGWAIRGKQGLRFVENDAASAKHQAQPSLASDGLSFEARGAGGNGLNESGTTYTYVAIGS